MVYKQGAEVVHDKSTPQNGDATKTFYEDLHKSRVGKPGATKEDIAAAEQQDKNFRNLNTQLHKDGLASDLNVVGAAKVNNEFIVFYGTNPKKNDQVYALDDKGKIKDVYDVKTDGQGHKVFVKEKTTDRNQTPNEKTDPKEKSDKSKWTEEPKGVFKDSDGHVRQIDRKDGKKEMVDWEGNAIKQVKIVDSSGVEKETFTRNGDKFDHTVDGKQAPEMKKVTFDGTTLVAGTDLHETRTLSNGAVVDYEKENGAMRPKHVHDTASGTEITFGTYDDKGKPSFVTIKKGAQESTYTQNGDGTYSWSRYLLNDCYDVDVKPDGTLTLSKYNAWKTSYTHEEKYDPAAM